MSEDDPLTARMKEKFREEYKKVFDEALAKREADRLCERNKNSGPYTIGNVCWIISAMAVFYLTDFVNALRYDDRIDRKWLSAGILLCGINISIAIFLIMWLTCIKKVSPDEWEMRYPYLIPIATAAMIAGGFCLNVALWSVWNILTPIILFILFMGGIVTLAMIPAEMPFTSKKKQA